MTRQLLRRLINFAAVTGLCGLVLVIGAAAVLATSTGPVTSPPPQTPRSPSGVVAALLTDGRLLIVDAATGLTLAEHAYTPKPNRPGGVSGSAADLRAPKSLRWCQAHPGRR